MKKLFAIVAVAAMFAACGGNKPAENTDSVKADSSAVVVDTNAVDTNAVDTTVAAEVK